MDSTALQARVAALLDDQLKLQGKAAQFTAATPLLGGLPGLDSLGVVGVISALERTFQIRIEDDEIDGAVFQTLGTFSKIIKPNTRAQLPNAVGLFAFRGGRERRRGRAERSGGIGLIWKFFSVGRSGKNEFHRNRLFRVVDPSDPFPNPKNPFHPSLARALSRPSP
jgi:acyl carrier protein